eukprot:CAMPEP_0119377632 /NCGR_PEP_ID=MMETSP1334-20130426/45879_1 /TAXON_ID=127549 /ORGANISM="Calcidiscus leptoporus, Strain RCC1130" /LENGTH=305 /DNA_ID=CAMNT_0007396615 /DNA_START=87 /DNA_END=1004 /DNA_ORIENTATION=+
MGGAGGKKKLVRATPIVVGSATTTPSTTSERARAVKPLNVKAGSSKVAKASRVRAATNESEPLGNRLKSPTSESEGETDKPTNKKLELDATTSARLKQELKEHAARVAVEPSPKRQRVRGQGGGPPGGGVLYLGHIPHGFYESQMLGFFSQFGHVTRLRLARNKKTGRSKHYAFIEFEHADVARIVAKSMNGYLLFSKVLVCSLMDPKDIHPDTFKGSKKETPQPIDSLKKKRQFAKMHNKPRTAQRAASRERKLVSKEARKRRALQAVGIEYDFPGYAAATKRRKTLAADSASAALAKTPRAAK